MKKLLFVLGEQLAKKESLVWEGHYTGIADTHLGRYIYLQRDGKTEQLTYFRFSTSYKQWLYINLGVRKEYKGLKKWFSISSRYIKEPIKKISSRLRRTWIGRPIAQIRRYRKEGYPLIMAYKMYKCEHDYIHETYLGEDSASETFHCPKCGHEGSHCYY